MKEELKTFDEWSQAGYKIRKGSKAKWVDNVPMFSRSQVEWYVKPQRRRKSRVDWTHGIDIDEVCDYTGEHGDPNMW